MDRSVLIVLFCVAITVVASQDSNHEKIPSFLKLAPNLGAEDAQNLNEEADIIPLEGDLASLNETEWGYSGTTCYDFLSIESGKSWAAFCNERNRDCQVLNKRSPTGCGTCFPGFKGDTNTLSFCKGPCQNIQLTPGGKAVHDWDTPEKFCRDKSADCVVIGEYDFYCKCWKSREAFSENLGKCVVRKTCSDIRMDTQTWADYCEKKNQACTLADHSVEPLCGHCLPGFRMDLSKGSCVEEFKDPCKLNSLTPGGRYWQTPEEYCYQRNSNCLSVGSFDFTCRCWNREQTFSKIQEQCLEETLDACHNSFLTPGGPTAETPENYCAKRNADCFSKGSTDFTCRCRQTSQVFSRIEGRCIGCLENDSSLTTKLKEEPACNNGKLTPFGRNWQIPNQYCNERRAKCVAQGNTNFYCECLADDQLFSQKHEGCFGKK